MKFYIYFIYIYLIYNNNNINKKREIRYIFYIFHRSVIFNNKIFSHSPTDAQQWSYQPRSYDDSVTYKCEIQII